MSVYDTFKCILSNEMIDIILRHTNKKTRKVYEAIHVAAKKFENAEKLEKLVLTAINRFVTNIVKI